MTDNSISLRRTESSSQLQSSPTRSNIFTGLTRRISQSHFFRSRSSNQVTSPTSYESGSKTLDISRKNFLPLSHVEFAQFFNKDFFSTKRVVVINKEAVHFTMNASPVKDLILTFEKNLALKGTVAVEAQIFCVENIELSEEIKKIFKERLQNKQSGLSRQTSLEHLPDGKKEVESELVQMMDNWLSKQKNSADLFSSFEEFYFWQRLEKNVFISKFLIFIPTIENITKEIMKSIGQQFSKACKDCYLNSSLSFPTEYRFSTQGEDIQLISKKPYILYSYSQDTEKILACLSLSITHTQKQGRTQIECELLDFKTDPNMDPKTKRLVEAAYRSIDIL